MWWQHMCHQLVLLWFRWWLRLWMLPLSWRGLYPKAFTRLGVTVFVHPKVFSFSLARASVRSPDGERRRLSARGAFSFVFSPVFSDVRLRFFKFASILSLLPSLIFMCRFCER